MNKGQKSLFCFNYCIGILLHHINGHPIPPSLLKPRLKHNYAAMAFFLEFLRQQIEKPLLCGVSGS